MSEAHTRTDYTCTDCGRQYTGLDGFTDDEMAHARNTGHCSALCREEAEHCATTKEATPNV
jgi:predicted nucleic acid-binding Zn ribbon protein